jgi:hypothetical protein
MEKVKMVFNQKPVISVIISLAYCVGVIFLKWQLHPTTVSLVYALGSIIGIYFLEMAEVVFDVKPSPFTSIVFCAGFVVLSLFIITSVNGTLASGLVFTLYLTLIMRMIGQWQQQGNLNSWFSLLNQPVKPRNQFIIMMIFIGLFVVETGLFVR